MDINDSLAPQTAAPSLPSAPPNSRRSRWINEGELTCKAPSCNNPIPAGWYGPKKSVYLCSSPCRYEYLMGFREEVLCRCGCGTRFTPTGTRTKEPFVNQDHFYAWRRQQTDKKTGRFAPLLNEFMETCAPKQYAETTLNAIRCNLVAFFSFLTRSRIRSLESVAPKTITVFFNELAKTRKKSAGTITGTVSCFFDWLAITGRRKAANPVVSRFHSQRRKKRLPRPYSREEMAQIFSLLEANGDLQLLVAVSLGAEAGLRISECAKVEISEIDLESQQLYVSLPTKVGTDRYAPFADKSKAFIEKWLQERGTLDHDRLLVGPSGAPMQKWTLRLRLNAVLCGPGKLAKFEYHRLRHYASSTMHQGGADDISVMAAFGWHNPSVMAGYTKTLPEQTRAHYDRAMAARDRAPETQTTVKTLDEFFSTSGDTSTNPA